MDAEKHSLPPISSSPLDSCRGRGKVGVPRRIRSNRTPRSAAAPRTATLLIASPAASSTHCCAGGHETPTPTVILFLGGGATISTE